MTTYAIVVAVTLIVLSTTALLGLINSQHGPIQSTVLIASWPFLLPGIICRHLAPGYGLFTALPILATGILIAHLIDHLWHWIASAIDDDDARPHKD